MMIFNKSELNKINNLVQILNKILRIVIMNKINLIQMMIKMMIVNNNRHNNSWRLRIMQ